MLTQVSGMSMTQISTWFANARRRMKKELNLFPYQKVESGSDSGNNTNNLSFSAGESTSDPGSPKKVESPRQTGISGISSYQVVRNELEIQKVNIPSDWLAESSKIVETSKIVESNKIIVQTPKSKIWSVADML